MLLFINTNNKQFNQIKNKIDTDNKCHIKI